MVQCDDPATASPPERGSVIIRCFGISFSASPKCEVGGLLAVTLETRALQRCGHTVPRSLHPPNKQHPLRRTLSPASRASHPRHDGIGRRVTVADLPVLRPVVCRDRGGVTAGAFDAVEAGHGKLEPSLQPFVFAMSENPAKFQLH